MERSCTLLLIAGLPGSGKTTLATALGRTVMWPVLDKDTIKTCLLRAGAEESLAGPASYDLLLDLAQDLLDQGHSVILDASAKYRSVLDRCIQLANAHNGSFRAVLCWVSLEEQGRRLLQRTPRLSQWSSLSDTRPGDDTGWDEMFPDDALVLDTSASVGELVAVVTAWLCA